MATQLHAFFFFFCKKVKIHVLDIMHDILSPRPRGSEEDMHVFKK